MSVGVDGWAAQNKVYIENLEAIQERMRNRIAAFEPGNTLSAVVAEMVLDAHAYSKSITHIGRYKRYGTVLTGGFLKASQLIRFEHEGLRGVIYLNPSAVNTITRGRPANYGVWEHRRGGDHAFFDRTRSEAMPEIRAKGRAKLADALLKGIVIRSRTGGR